MATISPVSTTAAWKTTPNDPLPMMRSAEYEICCSPLAAADAAVGEPAAASPEEEAALACSLLFNTLRGAVLFARGKPAESDMRLDTAPPVDAIEVAVADMDDIHNTTSPYGVERETEVKQKKREALAYSSIGTEKRSGFCTQHCAGTRRIGKSRPSRSTSSDWWASKDQRENRKLQQSHINVSLCRDRRCSDARNHESQKRVVLMLRVDALFT